MDSLLQNIQSFFLDQYKDLGSTSTFLAFEPLGCIINPDEYKDPDTGQYITAKADEDISEIVDRVPEISEVFIPGLEQVSSQYDLLVSGARFNADAVQGEDKSDYIALLGKLRDNAAKTMEDADRMSVTNVSGKYFPATTMPDTWYDVQSPVWAFKEFHAEKLVTEVPPENTPPEHRINFAWKKVALEKINPDLLEVADSGVFHRNLIKIRRLGIGAAIKPQDDAVKPVPDATATATTSAASAVHANFNKANVLLGANLFRPRIDFGQVNMMNATTTATATATPGATINKALFTNLNANASIALRSDFSRLVLNDKAVTETKPVESSNFSMSFDYCVVQVRRFWLDTKLFNYAKLWYSLALSEGFFSSGQKDISNRGCLRAIPKAFIIIKNLKINAAWSANDLDAAHSSVGLGFFNLMNSSVTNNQIENPSLQIIGWLCEAMPKMPVTSDPNLAP